MTNFKPQELELLDSMGSDLTVVNAARVSMGKRVSEFTEKDEKLVNYLARNGHWTPFSHVVLQFRIKTPFFVARQWFKHQVGFTRNEVSRRYVTSEPEFYLPGSWRERAENVKQGSGGDCDPGVQSQAFQLLGQKYQEALQAYETLLELGVCAEQARAVLPSGVMTEFVETGSLFGYARLVGLRTDPHAQGETRELAEMVAEHCAMIAPCSWRALTA